MVYGGGVAEGLIGLRVCCFPSLSGLGRRHIARLHQLEVRALAAQQLAQDHAHVLHAPRDLPTAGAAARQTQAAVRAAATAP